MFLGLLTSLQTGTLGEDVPIYLDYTIGGMGGLKQTLLSGEGLVMAFSGVGKIYLHTRYLGGLAGWLTPFCR